MNSLAHIDLLDLDRWVAEGPPFDWFAQLRAEAPVSASSVSRRRTGILGRIAPRRCRGLGSLPAGPLV